LQKKETGQSKSECNNDYSVKVNLNNYFYRNLPKNETHRLGVWSERETQCLIDSIYLGLDGKCDYITKDKNIKWGLLSLNIPGRNGHQCEDKYKRLIGEGRMVDIKTIPDFHPETSFTIYYQPALLPDEEYILVQSIEKLIENNQLVTSFQISAMAQRLYYEPEHLAKKACIYNQINQIKANHDRKSDEVVLELDPNDGKAFYMNDAINRPHFLMNKYNIPSFCASKAWVSNFLKKHKFVYREFHAKKRGAIKESEVEKYLENLNKALVKYGPHRVLNMDETQILVDNYPSNTIAKKGQKTVIVEKKFNDSKTGTTYIGTICYDPNQRFPLFCIAHGTTEVCERKYQNVENECQMDHSESGWTTVEVMKDYLNWLSIEMKNQPFALVLDIYATHITKDVKDLASQLKIELIYVPANGTGEFQPLDRTIFGIVKKELTSLHYHMKYNEEGLKTHKELYAQTHRQVNKIWNNISNKAIKSSWHMKGVEVITSNTEDDSEWKMDSNEVSEEN